MAVKLVAAGMTPADLRDKPPTVTGPRVKKLLKNAALLRPDESVRLGRGVHESDLTIEATEPPKMVGGTRRGAYRHALKGFDLYVRKGASRFSPTVRTKTSQELADEVDAWLAARFGDEMKAKAKKEASAALALRMKNAREQLLASMGAAPGEPVRVAVDPAIQLAFVPTEDGAGWTVDVFASRMASSLTTDELKALLAKVARLALVLLCALPLVACGGSPVETPEPSSIYTFAQKYGDAWTAAATASLDGSTVALAGTLTSYPGADQFAAFIDDPRFTPRTEVRFQIDCAEPAPGKACALGVFPSGVVFLHGEPAMTRTINVDGFTYQVPQ